MRGLRLLIVLSEIFAASAVPSTAHADDSGYAEVRDIVEESSLLRVVHHHDWSESTRKRRWKMISTDQNPFRADNDYSSLTVIDKQTGLVLFRSPVPALTILWISPDSKYVLGLSSIKLWNPYQVVLFDRTGRLRLRRKIAPNEACFSIAQYEHLLRRHPRGAPAIRHLSDREGDHVFVDFDDPSRLGGAWDALYRHRCPSHFSPSFDESVTNSVDWLDPNGPRPLLIERAGHLEGLELHDPKGKAFRIPIPQVDPPGD